MSIIEIDVDKIDPAPWNPKAAGDPEAIERLAKSIDIDKSAGVFAVRLKPNGRYEVIDGNHRLAAVASLGWKKITCENFGKISDSKAYHICFRRNDQWFDVDYIRMSQLIKDAKATGELDDDLIAATSPLNDKELDNLIHLAEWSIDDILDSSQPMSNPVQDQSNQFRGEIEWAKIPAQARGKVFDALIQSIISGAIVVDKKTAARIKEILNAKT
ncbi:parB_part, ParB/RepB/Spo0J family partition protein [uncultured Caudovirales phage]|uniref:ParB_part, ParB/RepB/Spo0J family partition protein n=1 Tax=uncultured Caudovirales phage TaxID=2100421 RepID=A0A6J5LUQ7_9CAUD|nr:parB_part, ParB/RepB/Spo0J family partition protein [uncultured Caudovirales phage]